MLEEIRNIAIIAHVDHGKTTLVNEILNQSDTLAARTVLAERAMDSRDLERERGITILAKNTAIRWKNCRINIVDTPGHADFGGEVERILSMVDSVLLLVDAVDGPMPQTRFVTQKAFQHGLKPIVVINKIDRPAARPEWVINQVFELFDRLGATEEQLDFPIVYASAIQGIATLDIEKPGTDLSALLDLIVARVPPPEVDAAGPFQMQISALDYSSYIGVIGIGRIKRGSIKTNTQVSIIDAKNQIRKGRVLQVLSYMGLERVEVPEASAGDIIAIAGIEELRISDTVCDPLKTEALPTLTVDEPTVSMTFCVNTSPFAGKEGKHVTSRKILERLRQELLHNVALRVEETEDPDKFQVSGRGELHLAILIEEMRREGYELGVSRPQVIYREVDGEMQEPYELLILDVEMNHQGKAMEAIGTRKGQLVDMRPDNGDRVRLEYLIPARGIIGFRSEFLSLTSGTGVMHHVFSHYGPKQSGDLAARKNGVMIANGPGKATGYSMFGLEERGLLFVEPQTEVYEGMIVGLHSRDNDIVVNIVREKQLTNMRASGKDDNIILTPPIKHTLEQALEFINDDELVEVTPFSIRVRKRYLKEHERKRESKN